VSNAGGNQIVITTALLVSLVGVWSRFTDCCDSAVDEGIFIEEGVWTWQEFSKTNKISPSVFNDLCIIAILSLGFRL
jgi:hypothetical protein